MRTRLSVPLLILSFITCSINVTAQGVSMSPTRLFFTGNPGETISLPVILSNSSNTDYVFSINKKDWKRDEDGKKIYFEAGSLENSNTSWISTMESSVNLPKRTDKKIMVTMKIPQNAGNAVSNSMIFFTQIAKQTDKVESQNGIGIIALFEFGLHIYYTNAGNTVQSVDIFSMGTSADKQLTEPSIISIGVENDGNVISDASVELELTNTVSGKEIKLAPVNISMLPGARQIVTFKLPEVLKGTYLGVSIIKMAGTNDMRVGEKTFEFK